ncbi:ribonuclease Z [Candidatus Woesearchaeota archaeon]|nr:ribonuclease Z [Candidatus Woesearchaeota archaeon]
MMEITFLGTGCMQPTKTRNHSGILLSYKTENILFDCGEGIQRQMRIAGIKPAKVTRILISHWHGDHVFGLAGLLSTMGADKAEKKIYIYGPPGTKKFLGYLLKSFASKDVIDHEVKEVKAGIFFENEDFKLRAESLKHSTICVGYGFIEKDKRRIDVVRVEKLKLKGPILGELQEGKDVIVEGKKIKSVDVTYVVPGKKISYVADTVLCEGAEKLASNVDLLISEGTHLEDIREKTEKYMHLTVKDAALLASRLGAKKLVITHISQRYKSIAEIVDEAKMHFEESIVAEDFMKIKI